MIKRDSVIILIDAKLIQFYNAKNVLFLLNNWICSLFLEKKILICVNATYFICKKCFDYKKFTVKKYIVIFINFFITF